MIIWKKVIFRRKFQHMKQKAVHVNRFFLVGILALSVSVSSCTRCEDCELSGTIERICESEFDNPNQYDDAIADREADGATCTPVSL